MIPDRTGNGKLDVVTVSDGLLARWEYVAGKGGAKSKKVDKKKRRRKM